MNHMTEYLKHKVINDNLRASTMYVGLFNETTEVEGASYERQEVTFEEPENGQTVNTTDILFPVAKEAWGNVTHVGIFNAVTGGETLFKSNAEVVKNVDRSTQYKIPANYLIVRLK